jgi:thioredoxin-like negative regulator of GroEL
MKNFVHCFSSFAPWCPACRALQPTWSEFGTWDHDLGLDGIASIDVTQAPGLSGRFMVTALPTIYQ